MKGQKGVKGTKGLKGMKGEKGMKGVKGTKGEKGERASDSGNQSRASIGQNDPRSNQVQSWEMRFRATIPLTPLRKYTFDFLTIGLI